MEIQTESSLKIVDNPRLRRKYKIPITIGAIILLSLIAVITWLQYFNFNFEKQSQTFTLNEILNNRFLPDFNGTWINDNEILYKDSAGNLSTFNINETRSRILSLTNSQLDFDDDYDRFELSPDQKYILLISDVKEKHKVMNSIKCRIIDLSTFEGYLVSIKNNTIHQYAEWTPKKNALVIVHENNIYYLPEIKNKTIYPITKTGRLNSIYNGIWNSLFSNPPNWASAMKFSPSGERMVYVYIDDSKTGKIDVPFYRSPNDNSSFQYPISNRISYPKAGTELPINKLYYVNLGEVASSDDFIDPIRIKHPAELGNSEVISYTTYLPNENLVVSTWLNRVQNVSYISLYDIEKSVYKKPLKMSQKGGWITQVNSLFVSENDEQFVMIYPQKQSDNDEWLHLVMMTINNSLPVIRPLTSGIFTVTEIIDWDEEKSLVYYLATVADDPAQQHFYRVSSKEKDPISECLSCKIKSENKGIPCLYNEAGLSPLKTRYILKCAGPDVPDTSIYNTNDPTKKLFVWERNSEMVNLVKKKLMPDVKRLKVPIPGGFNAEVQLFIPPGVDLTQSTKYPLLVYVYAGPQFFQVTEQFIFDWRIYLVTKKKFIYAVIDGHGSGRKSTSLLFSVYRRLGTVEIYDQINVTRHLQKKFPFIDAKKTAIWGWSYGGYAAGMSLALDHNRVFKCGISVAPVTDWRLYNSVYTESYMGLPTENDNLDGYKQAQLIDKLENITSNSYFLIHGTFDDNVHYQHSLLLANELQKKDILFRQQIYTNQNHGIRSSKSHHYRSMESFLDDCLNNDRNYE